MIINDVLDLDIARRYIAGERDIPWVTSDPEFNEVQIGAQMLYLYLYEQSILEEKAFWTEKTSEAKEYGQRVWFSLDASELEPYKGSLLSHTEPLVAKCASEYIWNEKGQKLAPCRFCGAVTIADSMLTYRSGDGGEYACTGRSWECVYCSSLNTRAVYRIWDEREKRTPRELQLYINDLFK